MKIAPEESLSERSARLQLLKQRAQSLLTKGEPPEQVSDTSHDAVEWHTLVEDLRTYQIELELQNEELRTAQMDAEMARKRYQYLFTQLPLAALVVDGRGEIDNCNQLAEQLLGERKRFVVADMRLWQKLRGADRSRMHVALREVATGETLVLHQVRLGGQTDALQSFDVHLIGLSIDYTLERRVLMLWVDRSAELARQADQQFYTSLLDSSDSLMCAADKQGKMLLANQAMLNFVGRSRAEVVGQPREKFLPLREAIVQSQMDKEVMHSGHGLTVEERVARMSTSTATDFLTRKFPLRDLAGEIYGVGCIATDITSLKTHQHLMLLSEAVFQHSAEAIIITDANTCIVRVNPAFTLLSGFSAESTLGKPTKMLKSGRHDKAFYATMWQAIDSTNRWSGEINNRAADGRCYTVWSTINAVRDAAGNVINYIAIQADVTQLQNAKTALVREATYDSLTGLPNRTLFNDRMAQLMSTSVRHNKIFALLFVDLDHFKEVNDTLGHQVGDQLLREIAHRLQEGVRNEDTVARIGGDEFVVLLPDTDDTGAQAVALNFLERLRQPVTLGLSTPYRPMASVGLAMYPKDGRTPDALLRSADLAMYAAKMEGRNRFAIYRQQLSDVNDNVFAVQTELAQALESSQLRVYFQPKCRLSDGAVVGAEALVRWQHPSHGLILPGEFIGVAQRMGLLVALDRWVINESLRQLAQWRAAGVWQPNWRLAVNQNVADLAREDMLPDLQAMLNQHQVSAQLLELEITEDALLDHTPEQRLRLQTVTAIGCTLAIDDFGTGYSSLAYLPDFPVSVIKIDQRFVRDMLSNEKDEVLVQTIVSMAHNLGHVLVAEGIETDAQQSKLRALGVEFGQGYLFGRPVDADTFAKRWLLSDSVASV